MRSTGEADLGGPDQSVAGSGEEASPYLSPEIVGCQFSIYPLRQADIDSAVRAAIAAARTGGCSVRVGNLSTLLAGSEEEIFRSLRAAFHAAQDHGSAVMTATLAAGMPSDGLVAEIQQALDAR
jgi:uncharacterized protein YqgV (UPF0045/DUF77 family)